jgi:hypothetical protein
MNLDEMRLPLQGSLSQMMKNGASQQDDSIAKPLTVSVTAVEANRMSVTVKVETSSGWSMPLIDVPVAGAEYIRYPIQVGDIGLLIPSKTPNGDASGAGGQSSVRAQFNFSACYFQPVGNATWSPESADQVTMYGKGGVHIRLAHDESKQIDLSAGAVAVKHSAKIDLEAPTIEIKAGGANSILGGASVLIKAPSVTITDGTYVIIPADAYTKFQANNAWYASHTHAAVGAPPSGAPPFSNIFGKT